MNTMNPAAAAATRFTLRQLLVADALTCLVTGVLLVVAAVPLAGALGLPQTLLFYAGVVLFPCAALMGWAARSQTRPLVWTVILGNIAWAVASVLVTFLYELPALGMLVVLTQAAVVAALGAMERRAMK